MTLDGKSIRRLIQLAEKKRETLWEEETRAKNSAATAVKKLSFNDRVNMVLSAGQEFSDGANNIDTFLKVLHELCADDAWEAADKKPDVVSETPQ